MENMLTNQRVALGFPPEAEQERGCSFVKPDHILRYLIRDCSRMNYKLLIGGNWLSGNFLVDVDMKVSKNGVR